MSELKEKLMPRATMIKDDTGRFELVDAFTHEHIKWLSKKEVEKYKINPFLNRKALVAQNGRYITVLGKDGKEWRLCPASFCTWAAKDPEAREVIGFGENVWEAIKEAEGALAK